MGGDEMKKTLIWTISAAIIFALAVWIASEMVPFSYTEWSFFIGLGITGILFLFNSSGGFLSKNLTLDVSETVLKVQKDDNELKLHVGGVFYGAVLYTIVSFIVMLAVYF